MSFAVGMAVVHRHACEVLSDVREEVVRQVLLQVRDEERLETAGRILSEVSWLREAAEDAVSREGRILPYVRIQAEVIANFKRPATKIVWFEESSRPMPPLWGADCPPVFFSRIVIKFVIKNVLSTY